MNKNNQDYWSEIRWQSKLTSVLKNINPTTLESFAKRLQYSLGIPVVHSVVSNDSERWTVSYYGGKNNVSVHLILYLHDPKTKTVGVSWLEIYQPTVEIVDFIVHPKGQGIGTKTMQVFFDYIEESNLGFEIMMLRAQDKTAARFWRKNGFISWNGPTNQSLSMTRPINLKHKKSKTLVKLSYTDSLSKKSKIINSYHITSME
ncbi:GNAT family N-acetyltransferase [Paenibacillus aurantiacus]|uniref:GNAT family N-acetyltransferase n=1 Tax=Paenibacillus aurantiacus TaxID=1936118 RepID=A0ABV5L2L6_9BACL